MKILFLHGWQSTPGGVKPSYLKHHGHDVLNPALPDDDLAVAVHIALGTIQMLLTAPAVAYGHEQW